MNPLNTRARRRVVVAVGAVAYIWATVAGVTGLRWALAPFGVAILCAFLVTHAARAYGVGLKRVDGRPPDERMSKVRDRAMAQACNRLALPVDCHGGLVAGGAGLAQPDAHLNGCTALGNGVTAGSYRLERARRTA